MNSSIFFIYKYKIKNWSFLFGFYLGNIMHLLMNGNLKTFAALSLVPLFIGVIIGYGINMSEAQVGGNPLTDKRIGAMQPKSYGYSTSALVCGDSLCNPPTPSFDVEEGHDITMINEHDENTPTAKLIQIQKVKTGSPNKAEGVTYMITYSIAAGKTNLENIHVHVSSDIESNDYLISSLQSYKTSKNVIRVKALDPDSIDGGITGYSLAPSTFDARDPNAQLRD
jgi:hypothetical protein